MTKSATRQSPTQKEHRRPRHRNVYDYEGEYEFLTAQHWTAPDEAARDARFSNRPVAVKSNLGNK